MKRILKIALLLSLIILSACRTHYGVGIFIEKGYGSEPPHQTIILPDTP